MPIAGTMSGFLSRERFGQHKRNRRLKAPGFNARTGPRKFSTGLVKSLLCTKVRVFANLLNCANELIMLAGPASLVANEDDNRQKGLTGGVQFMGGCVRRVWCYESIVPRPPHRLAHAVGTAYNRRRRLNCLW